MRNNVEISLYISLNTPCTQHVHNIINIIMAHFDWEYPKLTPRQHRPSESPPGVILSWWFTREWHTENYWNILIMIMVKHHIFQWSPDFTAIINIVMTRTIVREFHRASIIMMLTLSVKLVLRSAVGWASDNRCRKRCCWSPWDWWLYRKLRSAAHTLPHLWKHIIYK